MEKLEIMPYNTLVIMVIQTMRTTYIIWYVAGYECEQHDNPADFYLDVVISCETLEMKGMINYYLLLKL